MISAVLFDLDGTLTDPKPGITRSIAYALAQTGLGDIDPETLGWCIGPPIRSSFARLAGSDDLDLMTACVGHYRDRFSEVGLYENAVYEGIPEVLAVLRADGLQLFVATSKPELFAKEIIRHFDLGDFFVGVVGCEMDGRREAKAEVIGHLLSVHGVKASECLMIGDREHDVFGARAHGISTVGAGYGFGAPGELESAGAWPVCDYPSELLAAIASHCSGTIENKSMS